MAVQAVWPVLARYIEAKTEARKSFLPIAIRGRRIGYEMCIAFSILRAASEDSFGGRVEARKDSESDMSMSSSV